jgi:hypothetical protein
MALESRAKPLDAALAADPADLKGLRSNRHPSELNDLAGTGTLSRASQKVNP